MDNINILLSSIRKKAISSEHLMPIFGWFGVVNYPIFHLLWTYLYEKDTEFFTMRIFAALLCTLLIVKDKLPRKFRKFLPFYWYFTVLYCLPFFCVFMFLVNHGSPTWSANFILATILLIIILDWKSFAIILISGCILGVITYTTFYGKIIVDNDDIVNLIINISWIILVCIFFSYSKQSQEKEKENYLNEISKLNASLEQTIQTRTKDLKEALNSKTDFLNNLSHEIRTPVHGFAALSEGLVENWNNFDDTKKLMIAKQVAINANRLTLLMNNLLDSSKFQNETIILFFKEIDLNKIIHKIVDECESLYISKKNIKINLNLQKNNYVKADENAMESVLRNLFVNAIKFSKDNSVIKVSCFSNRRRTTFSLEDDGLGIPEEELKLIFKPFYQSARTRHIPGGSGLGLSLCAQIVNKHHGEIWAENNIDGGAKFTFTLPSKFNKN